MISNLRATAGTRSPERPFVADRDPMETESSVRASAT